MVLASFGSLTKVYLSQWQQQRNHIMTDCTTKNVATKRPVTDDISRHSAGHKWPIIREAMASKVYYRNVMLLQQFLPPYFRPPANSSSVTSRPTDIDF